MVASHAHAPTGFDARARRRGSPDAAASGDNRNLAIELGHLVLLPVRVLDTN
jgi:hypothetical protein